MVVGGLCIGDGGEDSQTDTCFSYTLINQQSNVRWVGPRDIQVLAGGGLARIPTVRIV